MPRTARVVAVGAPHHITQRGNNRQDIFLSDADREFYLVTLAAAARDCELTLLGYCLMGNHVHLIAIPRRQDSLSRALRRAHSRYSQAFNQSYDRVGHLWQNRFFSCCLGRDHLVAALAYVDRNPLRAGLVGRADSYPWSSARAHLEERCERGLLDIAEFKNTRFLGDWAEVLARPLEEVGARIRQATYTGLPLGDKAFVDALEQSLNRRLRSGEPGRPRLAAATHA